MPFRRSDQVEWFGAGLCAKTTRVAEASTDFVCRFAVVFCVDALSLEPCATRVSKPVASRRHNYARECRGSEQIGKLYCKGAVSWNAS